MSSTIDAELATLHARIAQLEEAKKVPPPPTSPPREPALERLIVDRKRTIENSYHRKNMSDASKAGIQACHSEIQMLQSIVESLNRIHARLDALETK
jgi:hypothetical protein